MKRRLWFFMLSLLVLTGCWSSSELDEVALVHGVGLDKVNNRLNTSVEIIRPTGQGGDQAEGGGGGQHIILTRQADTLLEGARELIRYAKRRLNFNHTSAWVVGKNLVEDKDFIKTLDTLRRDQMLRLNSYIFATEEDPSEVLQTETLYENLTSIELVSGLDQVTFVSDYTPIKLRELYRMLEGPVPNAYLPIITIENTGTQTITAIGGTVVLKDGTMSGVLSQEESIGLNWLMNRVKGGDISVIHGDQRVALEITQATIKTNPIVRGNQVDAEIQVEVEGTLADNMMDKSLDEQVFKEIEEIISDQIKYGMYLTLRRLQKDFQTDITKIGLETHRKHPQVFQELKDRWNDVFAQATIDIQTDVTITHEGLIRENMNQEKKKPNNNPYRFFQR